MEKTKTLLKTDYTPAVLDNEARTLLKAADFLEKDGLWGQGSGGTTMGSHCAMTAIWSFDTRDRPAAARFSSKFGDERDVMRWNDSPERTKDEVVAKLRAVALGFA